MNQRISKQSKLLVSIMFVVINIFSLFAYSAQDAKIIKNSSIFAERDEKTEIVGTFVEGEKVRVGAESQDGWYKVGIVSGTDPADAKFGWIKEENIEIVRTLESEAHDVNERNIVLDPFEKIGFVGMIAGLDDMKFSGGGIHTTRKFGPQIEFGFLAKRIYLLTAQASYLYGNYDIARLSGGLGTTSLEFSAKYLRYYNTYTAYAGLGAGLSTTGSSDTMTWTALRFGPKLGFLVKISDYYLDIGASGYLQKLSNFSIDKRFLRNGKQEALNNVYFYSLSLTIGKKF